MIIEYVAIIAKRQRLAKRQNHKYRLIVSQCGQKTR